MLLFLALICLGGAAFAAFEFMTYPARLKERSIRRASDYGRVRVRPTDLERLHFRQRVLAPAVTIQRQVGGSLATLIDMVAETVRQRQQFQRRIRALTAMGRMSAYVLVALPFFLAFMMTLINKSFMAPLWQRHVGHEMIILSLIMIAIGSAILKKIVSFKG